MASKLFTSLFIFSLLFIQILARDVRFFSKVSPSAVTSAVKPQNNPKQDQDPTFIPESQNAYGLYGNQEEETTDTQFPTTTKLAGDTAFTQTRQPNYPNSNPNYSNEQFTDNAYGEQNNNFENQETAATQFPTTTKLAGDTTFSTSQTRTREPNYPNSNPNYSNEQFSENNNFEERNNYRAQDSDSKYNYYSNNGGNWNKNGERQGMSDTRFMENGKYYYDVQNENNNNNNNYFPNYQQNSRGNYNNNENSFEFENSSIESDFPENEQYVP